MYERKERIDWPTFNSAAGGVKDVLGKMGLNLDQIVPLFRTVFQSMSLPDNHPQQISFLDFRKGVYDQLKLIQTLNSFPSLLPPSPVNNNDNNIDNNNNNNNNNNNYNNYNDDEMNSIRNIEKYRLDKRSIEEGKIRKKKTFGLPVLFGHEQWDLVINIMVGLRKSLSAPIPLNLTYFERFHQIEKYSLEKWEIEDISPRIFSDLRDHFRVNQSEYEASFSPECLIGQLLLGRFNSLKFVSNSGRGGGIFFATDNGNFFVKTIPDEELLLFRRILISYYEHILSYPNTLLTRFYGLYRIKQTTSKEWMCFVVMENLFFIPQINNLSPQEVYDLKGSTVNRNAKVVSGSVDKSTYALKDNDFKRSIKIGPHGKSLLLQQIDRDVRWMESHYICDYSLLVGFHTFAEPLPDEPFYKVVLKSVNRSGNDLSLFRQYKGGMLSADGSEIYFIGVIDILTEFNFKKKSEKIVKSLYYDSSKISAMEPTPYRRRFIKYVASILD